MKHFFFFYSFHFFLRPYVKGKVRNNFGVVIAKLLQVCFSSLQSQDWQKWWFSPGYPENLAQSLPHADVQSVQIKKCEIVMIFSWHAYFPHFLVQPNVLYSVLFYPFKCLTTSLLSQLKPCYLQLNIHWSSIQPCKEARKLTNEVVKREIKQFAPNLITTRW